MSSTNGGTRRQAILYTIVKTPLPIDEINVRNVRNFAASINARWR